MTVPPSCTNCVTRSAAVPVGRMVCQTTSAFVDQLSAASSLGETICPGHLLARKISRGKLQYAGGDSIGANDGSVQRKLGSKHEIDFVISRIGIVRNFKTPPARFG